MPGDGRFNRIGFTADDGMGATCSLDGGVQVVVPHDQSKKGSAPVDSVVRYDPASPRLASALRSPSSRSRSYCP